MGWKAVKEHYKIKHIVQVSEGDICIGSPYIYDIIRISLDGRITKRDRSPSNDDFVRYQAEFDADPETLKRLVESPDTFSEAVTVYTYKGGEIIEKVCEKLEWPHVTQDGQMMHDNDFSTDKAKVVAWAKRNADYGIQAQRRNIEEIEAKLLDYQGRLASVIANRERLEADYPDVVVEPED